MQNWLKTLKLALEGLKVLGQNIETLKALAKTLEEIRGLLETNRIYLDQIATNTQAVRDVVSGDATALSGLKAQLDVILARIPSLPGWR